MNKKIAICGDYLVMISIFTEIALYSPKTYKVILSIISNSLVKFLRQMKESELLIMFMRSFRGFRILAKFKYGFNV